MTIIYLHDAHAESFAREMLRDAGREEIVLQRLPDDASGAISLQGENIHLLVSGNTSTLQRVVLFAFEHGHSLGMIPMPDQGRLTRSLSLPKKPKDLLDTVCAVPEEAVDLLFCNETPVLGDVRIGENALLESYEYGTAPGIWTRLRRRAAHWKARGTLRHHRFRLTTDKEETIVLSAIGLIGLNHNNHSWIGNTLRQDLSATDGQAAVVALAPTSLVEFYLLYPVRLAWRRWRKSNTLPESWGYLKSSQITIESDEALDVIVDDRSLGQTPAYLRIEPSALRLSVGASFRDEQHAAKSSRNAIRLANVPRDEERIEYFGQGLPLFAHASQEQYATLFSTLREESQLGWTFVILLVLSTVLATLGLFINSASVIIGAMLLAPLMQPIVGLSMGVLRRDSGLLQKGTQSIVVGVGLVLFSAMAIAFVTPIHALGSEMAARLSPTILDLLVAITSGAAAAYAKNNTKISGSLVGVAIAVALVPPLAVSGIGLGWGDWGMFSNAMLLFFTNLTGIVLAAASTFFLLGFSPIRIAKRGIVVWIAIVALVSIPLYQSFDRMKTQSGIRQTLERLTYEYHGQHFALGRVDYVERGMHSRIRCEVTSDRVPDDAERSYLREMIEHVVGRPVDVFVTFRYRL